jgi:hypothetical protein
LTSEPQHLLAGAPPAGHAAIRGGLLAFALAAAMGCADLERGEPAVPSSDGGAAGDVSASDGSPAARSFARDVRPLLIDGCGRCHSPGGQAADSALVLGEDAARDREAVLDLINPANPGASRLLSKGAGLGHGGGAIYGPGTPEYQIILEWISQGSAP